MGGEDGNMILDKFLSETLDGNTLITICRNERGEVELRIIKDDKVIAIISDVVLVYNGNVHARVKEWIEVSKRYA